METRSVIAIDLEYRAKGRSLSGVFPYGRLATIASSGTVRKERFASRAFEFAIEAEDRELHLLRGHDYGEAIARRPAAGRGRSSLEVEDRADGVHFSTVLPEPDEQTMAQRDVVRQLEQGLIGGLSPGFQVPAQLEGAERLVDEPGNPGVMIREIHQAVLFELSLVTRPTYDDTEVDLRSSDLAARGAPRRRWWYG